MSIENQIAIHADEPDQLSANEMLVILLDGRAIHIDGEYYDLSDITYELNNVIAQEFCEAVLCGGSVQIREIYIKTIQEMME
jgi:hypothetical protein